MTVLDSHQHFWSLANHFTDWPTPDLDKIHRDWLPGDLAPVLRSASVAGTILVQAAPSIEETDFLLELAATSEFVRGVVGWIDFDGADPLEDLSRIAANPLLRGVRPMVQDIAAQGWLVRPEFDPIFEALVLHGLAFDALVRSVQLPDVIALAQRHPALRIALDHGGKPRIAEDGYADWARVIETVSRCPNVSCKLSGLWTEAGADCSVGKISPYATHLIACFGSKRLMWGSDWPVLELAGSYADWLDQCRALLADQTDAEQDDIFGGNARRFYGLD